MAILYQEVIWLALYKICSLRNAKKNKSADISSPDAHCGQYHFFIFATEIFLAMFMSTSVVLQILQKIKKVKNQISIILPIHKAKMTHTVLCSNTYITFLCTFHMLASCNKVEPDVFLPLNLKDLLFSSGSLELTIN